MSDVTIGDRNVYIMFDSGNGRQVEEWTVPIRAGDPWVTRRNVTVNLACDFERKVAHAFYGDISVKVFWIASKVAEMGFYEVSV